MSNTTITTEHGKQLRVTIDGGIYAGTEVSAVHYTAETFSGSICEAPDRTAKLNEICLFHRDGQTEIVEGYTYSDFGSVVAKLAAGTMPS